MIYGAILLAILTIVIVIVLLAKKHSWIYLLIED
jgi:hypothetical protein